MVTRLDADLARPVSHEGMLHQRRGKSRRRLLVILALSFSDILLALALWQAAFVLHGLVGHTAHSTDIAIASTVPYIVVWVGLRASLGLYPGYGLDQVEELRRQTIALLSTVSIIVVLAFASQLGDSLSRVLLFVWSLGLLLVSPVVRHFVKRAMMKIGLWGKPVVVLGSQATGARVLKVLQQEWQLGFKPVSIFDNRLAPAEGTLEGVPYGGTLSDAVAFAREHRVDTAIFAMPHTRREHLARFVNLVSNSFQHIIIMPNLDGITNSAVVARDFSGSLGLEIKQNLLDPWAQRLKRMLDIMITLVGGIFLIPLMLMLYLFVWIESGGSVFYRDRRMGRDGRLFSCIKFRTMVPGAETVLQRILEEDTEMREEYLKYHKLRNDPRVTRIGFFLRKTSLDELPQLWNVLRGEMSLVGPRPYLPSESEDIGVAKSEILRVTPGITGPWQVTGRNYTSFSERVQMDAYYVRDWSVWLDLVLLARTLKIVIFRVGAY